MRTLIVMLALASAAPAVSAQTTDTSPAAIIQIEPDLPMDYARIDVYQRDGTYAVIYLAQMPIAGYSGLSSSTAEMMLMLFSTYHGGRDYPDQMGQRILLSTVYRSGSSFFVIRNSTILYNPRPTTTTAPEPSGQVGTLAAATIYESSWAWGEILILRPSGAYTRYYFLKTTFTHEGTTYDPLSEVQVRMMLTTALNAPNYLHIDHTVNLGGGSRVLRAERFPYVIGSRIVAH
jgi:hypothetical protein